MTLNWCNRRDGGDSSQSIYGMRASLHGGISSVKEAPVSTGNTRKETGLRSLGLACPGSSATCCRVVHKRSYYQCGKEKTKKGDKRYAEGNNNAGDRGFVQGVWGRNEQKAAY